MKIRKGFVSNSSSMSFIASLDSYNNVFHLAMRMMEIQIEDRLDDDMGYNTRELTEQDYEWIDRLQSYIDKLKNLEEIGIDPNTPVIIPSTNFDTRIVQKNAGYYVTTSNNHYQWEDLEGIIKIISDNEEYSQEEIENFRLSTNYYFYDVVSDIVKKELSCRDYPKEVRWCNKHLSTQGRPITTYRFMIGDGDIICPRCDKEKLDRARLIQTITEESSL